MRTIRVYTDIELYFAVFAAFAAAFHIGLAFSSSQIATKEDNSITFFLLSMLFLDIVFPKDLSIQVFSEHILY